MIGISIGSRPIYLCVFHFSTRSDPPYPFPHLTRYLQSLTIEQAHHHPDTLRSRIKQLSGGMSPGTPPYSPHSIVGPLTTTLRPDKTARLLSCAHSLGLALWLRPDIFDIKSVFSSLPVSYKYTGTLVG